MESIDQIILIKGAMCSVPNTHVNYTIKLKCLVSPKLRHIRGQLILETNCHIVMHHLPGKYKQWYLPPGATCLGSWFQDALAPGSVKVALKRLPFCSQPPVTNAHPHSKESTSLFTHMISFEQGVRVWGRSPLNHEFIWDFKGPDTLFFFQLYWSIIHI